MCRSGPGVMFRGRPASMREGVPAATGVPGGCGSGRPYGNSLLYFFLEVVALEIAQGKGGKGTLRPKAGLQTRPKEGGEDSVKVEVQFVLRADLTILEAQVLLGIAEGKLNLETGAVETEDAFRRQLRVGAVTEPPSVVCGSVPRGRTWTPCLHGQAWPCSSAWYRATFSPSDVVRGAGHACPVAAVEATVERPRAARSPRVGPGVAIAQDRVPAQPAHHVPAQRPHTLHEGPGTV